MSTVYEMDVSLADIELAQKHGFDPTAPIVPSMSGIPVSTGMTPEEYDATIDLLMRAAKEAVV